MHKLILLGREIESLETAIGAMKHMTEECWLVWENDDVLDPVDEDNHIGPLLAAPPGRYHLWVGKPDVPLYVSTTRIILGTSVLFTRRAENEQKDMLEEGVRKTFSELLARSEKLVHVYQDSHTGHRRYDFTWPQQASVVAFTGYDYLGVANLSTGKIGS